MLLLVFYLNLVFFLPLINPCLLDPFFFLILEWKPQILHVPYAPFGKTNNPMLEYYCNGMFVLEVPYKVIEFI